MIESPLLKNLKGYIGGQWKATGDNTFDVYNPAMPYLAGEITAVVTAPVVVTAIAAVIAAMITVISVNGDAALDPETATLAVDIADIRDIGPAVGITAGSAFCCADAHLDSLAGMAPTAIVVTVTISAAIIVAIAIAVIAVVIVRRGGGHGGDPADNQCTGNNLAGTDAVIVAGLSGSGRSHSHRTCGDGSDKAFGNGLHGFHPLSFAWAVMSKLDEDGLAIRP